MSPFKRLALSRSAIFFAAFLFPLLIVLIGHRYEKISPAAGHFAFGWEEGRVAASLVQGYGYASPFPVPTGATAFVPPVYPLLMAGVFRLLGVYSVQSAIVLLILNCLFSGLTAVLVFLLSDMLFGATIAVCVGWSWALNPYAAYLNSSRLGYTSLATLLILAVLLLAYRLGPASKSASWFGMGALCALAALTNSSVSLILILLWMWQAWRLLRSNTSALRPMMLTFIGFVLLYSPWVIRNYIVFGKVIPLRSNLGLELAAGNCLSPSQRRPVEPRDIFESYDLKNRGAQKDDLLFAMSQHPSVNKMELERVKELGEIAYMAQKRNEAFRCIVTDPTAFGFLTLRRIIFTWTGAAYIWPEYSAMFEIIQILGVVIYSGVSIFAVSGLWILWRKSHELALPFVILLLVFPVIYYVTHMTFRYRFPIDPEILSLACFSLISAIRRGSNVAESGITWNPS